MTQTTQRWLLELGIWIGAAVIAALIVLPILNQAVDFPWLYYNVSYAIAAVLLLRLLFLLDSHPLHESRIFKILLVCMVPLLFFPVLEGIHSFLEYKDQVGLDQLMQHLPYAQRESLSKYISIEYVLLGVTTMLGLFALLLKMIRSLWRQMKFSAYE